MYIKKKERFSQRKDTYCNVFAFEINQLSGLPLLYFRYRVAVRLGEYDLTKQIDCLGNTCADPVVVVGVEQKIPHEGYNEKNKNRANDIGLIRLDSEVTFSDYVRPICLPSSANSPRTLPNERLVSAGWGRSTTSECKPLTLFKIEWAKEKNWESL